MEFYFESLLVCLNGRLLDDLYGRHSSTALCLLPQFRDYTIRILMKYLIEADRLVKSLLL